MECCVANTCKISGEMLPSAKQCCRRNAERRLAHYAAAQPVQVYLDPVDPARSVLECRAPIIAVWWTMLVVVWIILIVGLALLLTPGLDGPKPILRL